MIASTSSNAEEDGLRTKVVDVFEKYDMVVCFCDAVRMTNVNYVGLERLGPR